MRPVLTAALVVLAFAGVAGAAPPVPYHAVEGPFATVEEYCRQRLGIIHATCTEEPAADVPIPKAVGPLRSIRIVRVRASDTWHWNRRMLVLETARGLYVDERVEADYDRGKGSDAVFTELTLAPRSGGGQSLFVALHGTRAAGADVGFSCLADSDGAVWCADPWTRY